MSESLPVQIVLMFSNKVSLQMRQQQENYSMMFVNIWVSEKKEKWVTWMTMKP